MAVLNPGFIYRKQLECSCTDFPGQDANPSQVPSQKCWYSFAAEYTEANWGLMKLPLEASKGDAWCGD